MMITTWTCHLFRRITVVIGTTRHDGVRRLSRTMWWCVEDAAWDWDRVAQEKV